MKENQNKGVPNQEQFEQETEGVNLFDSYDDIEVPEEEQNVSESAPFNLADFVTKADRNINKIIYKDSKGNQFIVSDLIEVIEVRKNLDSQNIRIKFLAINNGSENKFEGSLYDIQRGRIMTFLSKKGIFAYDQFKGVLSEYLIRQVEIFSNEKGYIYKHERVGWNEHNDLKKGFFASTSIGAPYQSSIDENKEKILGPNGDKKIYDDMVNKEVLPNVNMQLPFVLAFTAPLVPLLYGCSATPVLMTNFAGKSSHGKTTSLALMASV